MFLFSPFFHRLCSTLVAFFALLDLFVCFVVFFLLAAPPKKVVYVFLALLFASSGYGRLTKISFSLFYKLVGLHA